MKRASLRGPLVLVVLCAARVRALVTDVAGAMPSFAEELNSRQIGDVAAFVSQSARK